MSEEGSISQVDVDDATDAADELLAANPDLAETPEGKALSETKRQSENLDLLIGCAESGGTGGTSDG